jgi:hypothetical protein
LFGLLSRLVLSLGDLASGSQLPWLPVADGLARRDLDAREVLVRQEGPPLVFQADNGSAFLASELGDLLAAWRVGHLFSPPRAPRYNGACAAGIYTPPTT